MEQVGGNNSFNWILAIFVPLSSWTRMSSICFWLHRKSRKKLCFFLRLSFTVKNAKSSSAPLQQGSMTWRRWHRVDTQPLLISVCTYFVNCCRGRPVLTLLILLARYFFFIRKSIWNVNHFVVRSRNICCYNKHQGKRISFLLFNILLLGFRLSWNAGMLTSFPPILNKVREKRGG